MSKTKTRKSSRVLTPAQAQTLIEATFQTGSIFSVTFYKKGKKSGEGKNEVRTMRARLGSTVKRGLAGGSPAYKPGEHGLIWVYLMAGDDQRDADPKHRRSIAVEGITRLVIGGTEYEVSGQPHA